MRPVPAVPRVRRADARRNREAILAMADQVFTEDGAEISLHEIAQRTGLSRATVYRHFPDRTALAVAVAAEHIAALEETVAREGSRTFRDLLHTVLSMQAERRSLVRLFRELPERERNRHVTALIRALRPAFERSQREGGLRDDVEPTDLAMVFEMLEAALATGDAGPSRRLVQVILDGLCPPPLSTVAGPAR